MIEWRSIAGWEGQYEVSNTGRVRNVLTGRLFHVNANSKGYVHVSLYRRKPERPKTYKVHRLVAEAFLPNPDGLEQVNHKDLNKLNNAVANLEWVSHKDNQAHAYANGVYDAVLSEERRRKLTPEDVVALRARREAGESYRSIGADLGLNHTTVSRIARGATWPTVPGRCSIAKVPRRRLVNQAALRAEILSLLPTHCTVIARHTGRAPSYLWRLLEEMIQAGEISSHMEGFRRIYVPAASQAVGTSNAPATEGE